MRQTILRIHREIGPHHASALLHEASRYEPYRGVLNQGRMVVRGNSLEHPPEHKPSGFASKWRISLRL